MRARTVTARGLAWLCAIGVAACSHAAPPQSPSPLPPEVRSFIDRRGACDHFRGEEPYDAARKAEIAAALATNCTGTDADLARLRRTYRTNRSVTNALAAFEASIE